LSVIVDGISVLSMKFVNQNFIDKFLSSVSYC